MSSSGRGPTDERTAKTNEKSKPDAEQPVDENDAEIIEKQIGPGLRSMYSNVLSEDLPEDLLAVVNAMASKEQSKASEDADNFDRKKRGEADD